MKALDTPVLLSLLEGDPGARDLVKRLRGVEVATTEANLLELAYLAARGSRRTQTVRRKALERLRRKLTVLPIDARAVEEGARRLGKGAETVPPLVLAMLGALEAGGCDELFTTEGGSKTGTWRFKVSRVTRRAAK